MNASLLRYYLGSVLSCEALLMLIPFGVSVAYGESEKYIFLLVGAALMLIGRLLSAKRPRRVRMEPREGWRRYELPVQDIQYLGDTYEITLSHEGKTWMLHGAHKTAPGEKLSIYINPEEIISC